MTKLLLDAGPSLWGWSRQEDLPACMYRFALRYLLNLHPGPPSEPLIRGSLVHIGLAHFWTPRVWARTQDGDPNSLMSPEDAIDALATQEDHKLRQLGHEAAWHALAPLAKHALRIYAREDPHRHLVPLAVEWATVMWVQELAGPGTAAIVPPPPDAEQRVAMVRERRFMDLLRLGPPWPTSFRIDLLARHTDGRVLVVDHKTAGRVDERKRQGFIVSGQMAQFKMWGEAAFGAEFGGVYVLSCNVTEALADMQGTRGKTKNGTPKKVEPVFDSFAVPVRPQVVRAFPQRSYDGWDLLHYLLIKQGRHPLTLPRAMREQGPCSDRYGVCEMWDLCQGDRPLRLADD